MPTFTLPRAGTAAFAATVAIATILSTGTASAADPRGTWLSQNGEIRVRFADCGSQLCGTITWMRNPGPDRNNADESLRSRQLVGVRMVTMRQQGENWSGSLYNPQDGRTYNGRMSMTSSSAMSLSGCVLGGMICRSQTWSRVN